MVDERPAQAIERFDRRVDDLLDHWRGNALADRIFYTASELADFSLLWHLLAVARGVRRGGDVAETVRVVSLVGIESLLVNGVVKTVFRRARPVLDVGVIRPHKLRQPRTSSFPSGHASAAAVFAVVASDDDDLAPLYAVIAAVVAASRSHVRIHHASDVIGGLVVGTTLGAVMRSWWPSGHTLPRWPRLRRPRRG